LQQPNDALGDTLDRPSISQAFEPLPTYRRLANVDHVLTIDDRSPISKIASAEVAVEERKDRVDDSLHATRAAVGKGSFRVTVAWAAWTSDRSRLDAERSRSQGTLFFNQVTVKISQNFRELDEFVA